MAVRICRIRDVAMFLFLFDFPGLFILLDFDCGEDRVDERIKRVVFNTRRVTSDALGASCAEWVVKMQVMSCAKPWRCFGYHAR